MMDHVAILSKKLNLLPKILSGEKTAKEALDQVAAEWNTLTDRLGRDKQKEYYQWHLNYR